ncbi:hypothetical protein JW752_01915 [Candidatus Peregrinibacteria bacterium]|nr:hypothetical protein [Candidatus Peregrinibacteria bacterium]
MLKRILASLVLLVTLTLSVQPLVYAADEGVGTDAASTEKSKVVVVKSPSECTYQVPPAGGKEVLPVNCLFLEEPIGGKPGYDLFLETCTKQADGTTKCVMELWRGGAIPSGARGPIQAVLTFEPDKPYEGPFGLLYNYLGLIYAYMSGLIIAVAILFVVIGGIQMSTAGGDPSKFDAGKSRIVKAVVGIILWFTASLILYTINPTFFAF